MNTNMDSVADAQRYLHSLIKSADEFNKANLDQQCTPNWSKAIFEDKRAKQMANTIQPTRTRSRHFVPAEKAKSKDVGMEL